MQCNAMQCSAMQCNAMQYNTIQYNVLLPGASRNGHMDSYLPRPISQSDCKNRSNCGKNSVIRAYRLGWQQVQPFSSKQWTLYGPFARSGHMVQNYIYW